MPQELKSNKAIR